MGREPLALTLLCAAICAPAPVVAQGAPVDRDAAIFGEDQSTNPPGNDRDDAIFGGADEALPAGDRDDAVFGTASTSDDAVERRLDEAQDPLAIGGKLYLRLQYTALYDRDLHEHPLRSPNLLDLYLDARPTPSLRAFVAGRLRHDFTVNEGDDASPFGAADRTSVALDQLWLKFDIANRVWITLGQQRIKWGAARFWNPTDFLNQRRLEPLAIFDERLGVPLIKVHVPIEALGWNLYALALLDGADEPGDVGGALRIEAVAGTAEISASVAARRGDPLRLGADVSAGLGPIDVVCEAAVTWGGDQRRWVGELDLATGATPTLDDRGADWIPRVAAGVEWPITIGDDDLMIWSAEGFYNGNGYDQPSLYPWLLLEGDYEGFYVGEFYASTSLVFPQPGSWDDTTLLLSGVGNLSDRTFVARFDWQTTVLTRLRLFAFVQGHFGDDGELRLRVDLPPVPSMAGLEKGLSIPPPAAEVGLWLALDL